jgi:hypothetical protein
VAQVAEHLPHKREALTEFKLQYHQKRWDHSACTYLASHLQQLGCSPDLLQYSAMLCACSRTEVSPRPQPAEQAMTHTLKQALRPVPIRLWSLPLWPFLSLWCLTGDSWLNPPGNQGQASLE